MNWKKIYDVAVIATIVAVLASVSALGILTYFTMKIQSVREEYKELEPKLAELKIKTETLNKDKKDLETATKKLTEDQKKLSEEKKNLEEQISNLDPELAKTKGELEAARTQLKDVSEDMQKQIDGLTSKLNAKTIEVQDLQSKLTRIQSLVQSTGDLIADIKEMKEKNDSNIIKIARLENDYQSALNRYSEAQSNLNKCKDAYRSYITSARGQGEIKPWWVQLPSYYGIDGPDSF